MIFEGGSQHGVKGWTTGVFAQVVNRDWLSAAILPAADWEMTRAEVSPGDFELVLEAGLARYMTAGEVDICV